MRPPSHRPRHRRRLAVTLALAAASLYAVVVTSTYRADTAQAADVLQLAYAARFEGVGMEGEDMIWSGGIGGRVNGEVTIRLRSLDPAAAASPRRRVRALMFVAADDPRDSFAAELDGALDWPTRRLELRGVVTDGANTGAPVVQRGELKDDYVSVGVLRITPPATLVARRQR